MLGGTQKKRDRARPGAEPGSGGDAKPGFFHSTKWHDMRWGYGLALPAILLTAVFVVYPLLRSVYLTFFDYSFLMDESKLVGLQNYFDWAVDPRMWHSAWIALKYFLLYVPANILLGLVIAIAIDRLARRRWANFYRAFFYFPVVLPAAIVFQMWMWIYNPSVGVIRQALREVGSDVEIHFLGNPDTALPSIAVMSIWRLVGETVIFFVVGLAAIPKELLESARIDGASEWQVILRMQLPMLTPMILLVFVLRLRVLEATTEMLYMTQGGPIDATMTYGLQAYMLFNRHDEIGYANTWFLLLAVAALLLAWFTSRLRQVTA